MSQTIDDHIAELESKLAIARQVRERYPVTRLGEHPGGHRVFVSEAARQDAAHIEFLPVPDTASAWKGVRVLTYALVTHGERSARVYPAYTHTTMTDWQFMELIGTEDERALAQKVAAKL